MKNEKFWILESPRKRTAMWDKGNLWRKSDYLDCPKSTGRESFLTFGGPANRIGELRVVLHGRTASDFVWTIPDCLVHDRALELLLREGLTGFETRRARVRWESNRGSVDADAENDWLSSKSLDYHELLVTGWGGLAAERSGVRRISNTNIWEGFPDWTRILASDQWDGSDFFIIWPFGFTRLVSDRAATLIRKANLSGVRLVTPEDYTRIHMSQKPGRITPMRLRDHFPDERARAIGEPLGIY
ncbi:MAG: hypothetical protein ABFD49_03630 [Armatimonadota bacterium]|nr:hypothetical protein [bacterium]